MPTRCDGAGGSGDVGTEGRHEIGLGRGVRVSQRPSSAVRSRGWQRRAGGALARQAAGTGAELAKGQEESTRSNGAGGSGDVGTESRHDSGLWRGVCASQRPSSELMSRGDRGAQAARELGAGHEPAPMPEQGQEASQRCDSEAGDGGVGAEGRRALGRWRGDGYRRASKVRSRW